MRWNLSLVLAGLFAFSFTAPVRADFCGGRTPRSMRATIERVSRDPEMRLAFKNAGGLAHGGVCWWHSRFQRAAWYLASFKPDLPAPTRDEARAIIRTIVSRLDVVEIPGFRDLASFSKEYAKDIQAALDAWQIRDAVINQAYIRGLSGQSHFRDPAAMRARIDSVYADFKAGLSSGDVVWVMLQMPGIVSHASLLHAMEPTPDGGYRIAMVDSNFPDRLVDYVYRPGDLELTPADIEAKHYTSVPYVGFGRDLGRIHRAIARYCEQTANRLATGSVYPSE